jgi:hypothetical protein
MVVRSVLYNPANNKPDDYQYTVLNQDLAMTYSGPDCSKTQGVYTFGNKLKTACAWDNYNQYYDAYFSETGKYTSDSTITVNQSYQFKGQNSNEINVKQWNYTLISGTESIWNRALGKASTGTLKASNQSSNSANATQLQSLASQNQSYLLGLQATNSVNNRDSNSNRLQLNTSFVRVGDNSSDYNRTEFFIPDDSKTNNINGARARTGHHFNHIFIFL